MVFLDLKDKVLFNKTSRGVGVTHMEEALVPWKYGMKMTSHRDSIFYGK